MQLANTTEDVIKLRIAVQLAPASQRRELQRLCEDIASGKDWPAAVDALAQRHRVLGDLMSAAMNAGHPASIVMQLMQQRAASRVSWRRLFAGLVYPLALVLVALVIGSLMSMSMLGMVTSEWVSSYDAGMAAENNIPNRVRDFYDASVGGLLLVVWCGLMAGIAYCLATPNAWLKLVSSLPVLGRPYRWMELSELLTRISVFSQFQPSLSKTLSLTEQSFGKQALAAISNYVLHATERGEALPSAIHRTIVSDARAGMALTLIDSADLSSSTLKASRLIDEMILATCDQLRLILPLFIFLIVGSMIWGVWSSYFEILVSFQRILF